MIPAGFFLRLLFNSYFFAAIDIISSIGLLLNSELTEFLDVLITTLVGLVLYGICKLFQS